MTDGFDAATAALLLIDLQNEYRGGNEYAVTNYAAVLANAATVLRAARARGRPVIHLQFWVEAAERGDYPLLDASVNALTRSAAAGSHGAALCEEVAPLASEPVIRKRWPSGFKQTDLQLQLQRLEVGHLMVAGVWSDSCVRGSVLDAVMQGHRVWLLKDACGSATPTMHRAAVLDLANRLYGGGVFTAAEAVKALQGDAHRVWRCSRPIEFRYTLDTLDALYETL